MDAMTELMIESFRKNVMFSAQISKEIFRCAKPEWFSENKIIADQPAFFLRKFSDGEDNVLIVPPQAGHNSTICDFDEGQSLVQTIKAARKGVYAIDWKPCTIDRKNESISDLIVHLLNAVNAMPRPLTLMGLCQGGWLSAAFASLFRYKIKHLIVAGSPINAKIGGGYLQMLVETLPHSFFEELVAMGCGVMKGELILMGYKMMHPIERTKDYLDLWLAAGTDKFRKIQKFRNWYEFPQDLPGVYYLEAVDRIFRKNELWEGKLEMLGRLINLGNISCPITSIAGGNDDITLKPQALALPGDKIVIPGVGHIGIFMARKSQEYIKEIIK